MPYQDSVQGLSHSKRSNRVKKDSAGSCCVGVGTERLQGVHDNHVQLVPARVYLSFIVFTSADLKVTRTGQSS